MSSRLANQLINAESPEAFMRKQKGRVSWRMFAELKDQVDLLVHSDLNQSAKLVERIEQTAALAADPLATSFAEASRARLLRVLGNHSEANALYESAARTLKDGRLRVASAMVQKQQVYALTDLGRYDDALKVARDARRVLAHGDRLQLAQLEASVGAIYYRLDRYKRALAHYDKAGDILPANTSRSVRAFIDGNRSNLMVETDEPEEAVRLLEKAVSAWERSGKKVAAAQARSKIAYIQFLRGNYSEALARYYVVRDQLETLGSTSLVAWCNLEIAEVLLALNSFADATDSAEAARSRFSEMGLQYESAQASMVKALAEMGLQQFEPAREAMEEARAVFEKNENTTFVALIDSYLGELALKRGDGSEALRRAESSLRLFTRQRLPARAANSRRIAAWAAYISGDQTKALRFAKSALRTAGPLVQPAVAYQCHHLIGKIERDRGRRALESFRRAVHAVESMRGGVVADEFKATFLRDKIEVYEDAISVCLDEGGEGRIEEAFRLVESSKSRALADLLARYVRQASAKKSRSASKGAQADARALLVKLIEDLNWYNSKAGLEDNKGGQRKAAVAERYRQKVQRCEKQIAQLFRRLDGGQGQAFENQTMQTAEAGLLCQSLEAGETAIEYFTTGDEISAFILSPDRIRVERDIASRREVEKLLAGLRFQLEKFNYGPAFADEHFEQLHRATNQHLGRLHELIFAALEPLIEGDRLIIMPHGALHYVPFHALLDRRGYLIDRFEVSYAPSAMVLNLCRQRSAEVRAKRAGFNGVHRDSKMNGNNSRRDVGKVVAFGIGDRDGPNIDHEVRELRAIFPDAVTLTGAEATRSNLMKFAPKARYLHLASHGYFRRDNPMFSFLKLADASLHFYNLLDLKLDAELVTLSACHTGVNMIFPGDELHGLMRGFLYAGAPSLVASLWAANDVSTAAFMRTMYMRISEGDSKRAALRAAQLAVKDEYGHPYYWAPFVLMGNPN